MPHYYPVKSQSNGTVVKSGLTPWFQLLGPTFVAVMIRRGDILPVKCWLLGSLWHHMKGAGHIKGERQCNHCTWNLTQFHKLVSTNSSDTEITMYLLLLKPYFSTDEGLLDMFGASIQFSQGLKKHTILFSYICVLSSFRTHLLGKPWF